MTDTISIATLASRTLRYRPLTDPLILNTDLLRYKIQNRLRTAIARLHDRRVVIHRAGSPSSDGDKLGVRGDFEKGKESLEEDERAQSIDLLRIE